jgi:7-alpha-hydroxysteroid dehydrogenase
VQAAILFVSKRSQRFSVGPQNPDQTPDIKREAQMTSILDQFALNGKVAVVTGAGRGIGKGIAIALADAGADIVACARSETQLQEVADFIRAMGRRCEICVADLVAEGGLDKVAETVSSTFGKLDIWVNNAGGLPDATPRFLTRTSSTEWDAQIDLNLKAVWAGSVTAARLMESGVIINLSSRASFGGHLKNGPYSAAKAAVNSLTQTFALELAPRIRVNALAPGPIATSNMLDSIGFTEDQADEMLKIFPVPLGRLGTPEDIGAAAVFLASQASSWITGQCLYVTGGF